MLWSAIANFIRSDKAAVDSPRQPKVDTPLFEQRGKIAEAIRGESSAPLANSAVNCNSKGTENAKIEFKELTDSRFHSNDDMNCFFYL